MARKRNDGFVSPEEFYHAMMDTVTEYSDEVTVGVKQAVDRVSERVMDEIKGHILFGKRTGKYIRSFAVKTSYEDKRNKRNTWYVKDPRYRLTHLLESGHQTRNGGMTRAYPHIIYGEEIAKKLLPELIEDVVQGRNI